MTEDRDPTFLGRVAAVSGASITVHLAPSLASGLAIIGGHTYRVGQVGSFVRIPQGYQDLFGVVSEVGANAAPVTVSPLNDDTGRWMRVELAGEAIGSIFERGISQHPNIDDTVHLVVEQDLLRIYGGADETQVPVGVLSSAESIPVCLSVDALVTRHSALLGSTGSGKSTTVASLLRSIICEGDGHPSARILLLDLHGEYPDALSDVARVYSATPSPGQLPLHVPFWALEAGELLNLVAGGLSEPHQIAFEDKILDLKRASLGKRTLPGVDDHSLTVDTPVPFSLRRLWHELVDFEVTTYGGANRDEPQKLSAGDAAQLQAPTYTPHAMGSKGPFINQAAKGIRRPLNLLRSRLLDRRYDFLLRPGEWDPDLDGAVHKDLDHLLDGWLGNEKPMTILDLSGVPSTLLVQLIGALLRIVYEALYWSREKSEGGIARPLLVVMEEAHRYLSPHVAPDAARMVQRIAKEGRKYGVGAMMVSQRPSEVDETILSQCGTIIALRLSNPVDRARVKGALPDNLAGLIDMLPVLRTGEAIITGEAARLPMRCRITPPPERFRPRSQDPLVSTAWSLARRAESYDRAMASWRGQRTTAKLTSTTIARVPVTDDGKGSKMDRVGVGSSNIASIGYDPATETLEIEFMMGTVYQYYNVPDNIYDQLMQSPSKGGFVSTYIKNAYAFSRV